MINNHKIEDIENLIFSEENISIEDIKIDKFQKLNQKTRITI